MTHHRISLAALSLLFAGVPACGEPTSNTGDEPATGGAMAASGGSFTETGGAGPSSGGAGSGGLSSSGGAEATGGGNPDGTGGAPTTGGAPASGGDTATGGDGNTAPDGTPVDRYGKLQVSGSGLADEQGNPVRLNGPSSMWLNWDDANYATNRDGLRFMRDEWGLEIFRIAMGITPMNAYLDDPEANKAKVRTIVENAIELGVYVIIDWHDHEGENHQSQAQAFFSEMATAYGEHPNVLYEIYNEPLDVSWSGVLKPYHQALIGTIRQHDPDNVIILGTPKWSQDVDVAAQDPVSGTNLIYTLHFYACDHTGWLRDKANTALGAGLPLFVTEWGATKADGGLDGTVCEAEAQAWINWMNQNNISWTAWKLDGCTDSSCYFVDRDVSTSGGWGDADLNGHAPFVIQKMRE